MELNKTHLGIFLSAAVPLRIRELESKGGPTLEDLRAMQEHSKQLREHGEALLFKSKKKGLTAQMSNNLASAIAILSFVPGGITLFGQHWESNI